MALSGRRWDSPPISNVHGRPEGAMGVAALLLPMQHPPRVLDQVLIRRPVARLERAPGFDLAGTDVGIPP